MSIRSEEPSRNEQIDTRPLEFLKQRVYHALDWELLEQERHVKRLAAQANAQKDMYLKQADCTNYITELVKLYDLFMVRFRFDEAKYIEQVLDEFGNIELQNSGGDTKWRVRL